MREAQTAPVRTCVGCRARRPQGDLLRIARSPDGIRFDPRRRAPGRGAHVCPDHACIDTAGRREAAALRRALRGGAVADAIDALEAARTSVVHQRVPDGTVRSEKA